MDTQLYNWLEQEFYRNNHSKYHKYFKEWDGAEYLFRDIF